MTNPYGQPGQPGGYDPQSGGFQQPGGYPQQAPGYPMAPHYGHHQQLPVEKPGSVTGAAVLGFIQAGITLITTALIFIGLLAAGSDGDGGELALGWLVALAQTAGIVLLIFGAVQLLSGTSRALYVTGAGIEIAVSLYYFIRIVAADSGGIGKLEDIKAAGSVIPIMFAVLPVIGLILALGSACTRYLRARAVR